MSTGLHFGDVCFVSMKPVLCVKIRFFYFFFQQPEGLTPHPQGTGRHTGTRARKRKHGRTQTAHTSSTHNGKRARRKRHSTSPTIVMRTAPQSDSEEPPQCLHVAMHGETRGRREQHTNTTRTRPLACSIAKGPRACIEHAGRTDTPMGVGTYYSATRRPHSSCRSIHALLPPAPTGRPILHASTTLHPGPQLPEPLQASHCSLSGLALANSWPPVHPAAAAAAVATAATASAGAVLAAPTVKPSAALAPAPQPQLQPRPHTRPRALHPPPLCAPTEATPLSP